MATDTLYSSYSPCVLDPTARCKEMEEQVRELRNELLRLKQEINSHFLTADSLPNFALESLGAKVVLHLSSEAHQTKETFTTLLGIPLMRPPVHQRTVIQGHSPLPGRCWAFAGGKGHLLIALSHPVTISHVTLEHISKSVAPTGTITSAPKEFTIYGMENLDDEGTHLGTFLYDQDLDPVQTFKTSDNKQGVFNYIKLQVESNWGHPVYSCLYGFRVHGKLANRQLCRSPGEETCRESGGVSRPAGHRERQQEEESPADSDTDSTDTDDSGRDGVRGEAGGISRQRSNGHRRVHSKASTIQRPLIYAFWDWWSGSRQKEPDLEESQTDSGIGADVTLEAQ